MIERLTIHNFRSRVKLLPAGNSWSGPPRHTLQRFTVLIIVMLLALAGCAPAPDFVANQLLEAVNAQELNTALSLFANKAVVNMEGSAPFSGKGEIQVWLERLNADNVKLTASEVLKQDEKSFLALYSLTTDSTSHQGVASLSGTGEITTRFGKITALNFSLSEQSRNDLLMASLPKSIPILSYAVLTDPDPLRASPGGEYNLNLASLTVVITNVSGEQVPVRSIMLRLPEGLSARDLTPNISGVNSEAPDDWNVTKGEGRFILAPELPGDGMLDPGQGLFITLSDIEINDQSGVWGLEIIEETGEATERSMTIPLVKFPFALYVSDLMADPLIIRSGETVTLFWDGSDGATYKLYFDGQTNPDADAEGLVVESVGSHAVRLEQTTTFYLTATLIGGEDPMIIRERTITVIP